MSEMLTYKCRKCGRSERQNGPGPVAKNCDCGDIMIITKIEIDTVGG